MQKLETSDMLELGQKVADVAARLAFLVGCVRLSPADIQTNSNVFQWYTRMPGIFEEHRRMIKEKTDEFQEDLKVCNKTIFKILELLILNDV